MSDAICEYYRLADSMSLVAAELTPIEKEGFFYYRGIICYGGLNTAAVSPDLRKALEVSEYEKIANGSFRVPFNIEKVIHNLRYERYIDNNISQDKNSLTRNFYYVVRRLLPVAVRKHLQRHRLRDWKEIRHPAWPVDASVDDLCAEILKGILKVSAVRKLPFIWYWPEGFNACIMITHDVESPKGRDFCEELMDIDLSYGFLSSFELIPEKRYEISDRFLENIRASGCEICLHGLSHDGHLFCEKEEFLRRAERINHYARDWGAAGFRSPVMYRNPEWLPALKIDYDMSWPSVGHLDPQRGGCCTVMPYFISDIVELPLTMTQDYSLFNILQHYDTQLWQDQIEKVRSRNGLISCIIHPDYVTGSKELSVYRDLLGLFRKIKEEGRVWTALPKEIAQWWRDRRAMRLVKLGTEWRIEGPGCERARIAWAELDGECLRVSVE